MVSMACGTAFLHLASFGGVGIVDFLTPSTICLLAACALTHYRLRVPPDFVVWNYVTFDSKFVIKNGS